MRTLIRCLRENRQLWHLWLMPGLAIGIAVPLVLCLPLVQRRLIDTVLIPRDLAQLAPTVVLYGVIWFAIAAVQLIGGTLRAYLDERLTLKMRRDLFAHCTALSVPLWHREHSGRTMSLFSSDVPSVAGFIGSGLVLAFGQLLTLLAGAVAMVHLNWQLAVVIGCVPPIVAGFATLATRPLRWTSRKVQDRAADLSERLHENLAGLREIAAFGQERLQSTKLETTLQALLNVRMRLAMMTAAVGSAQSVFSLTVTLTLISVGGYLVITGQTTLGTMLAMEGIYSQVYPTATALVATVVSAQRVLGSADRIAEFFAIQPRIVERADAREIDEVRGEVIFDDVRFAYYDEQPVLHGVSFAAQPGEVVALVGPSGAGKSTIAALIARFYDPDSGRVTLDGIDLRDLTLESVRDEIGIVFQDPFLFASTIRENIAFGWEDSSEAEIVSAARAANAWEFIEKLPKGLDTPVGQRGAQLSEGQKQRLAIARALLRDPRILIFDEPTSALDSRSERLLQTALEHLMHGRTTFIIAHRLATVQRADRILVIDGGRVVEQGSHTALMAAHGLYRELFELQFNLQPDRFSLLSPSVESERAPVESVQS